MPFYSKVQFSSYKWFHRTYASFNRTSNLRSPMRALPIVLILIILNTNFCTFWYMWIYLVILFLFSTTKAVEMRLKRCQETYIYVIASLTTFVVEKPLFWSCLTLKIFDCIGSQKEVEMKFMIDSFVTAFRLLFCF